MNMDYSSVHLNTNKPFSNSWWIFCQSIFQWWFLFATTFSRKRNWV